MHIHNKKISLSVKVYTYRTKKVVSIDINVKNRATKMRIKVTVT